MSGTDLGYDGIGLRACYAMPGTDLAYGAARRESLFDSAAVVNRYCPTHSLRDVRAMLRFGLSTYTLPMVVSGTHRVGYATFSPTVLRTPYAISGTDLGYAATRSGGMVVVTAEELLGEEVRYLPTPLLCDVRY
eukprot:1140171-Rhodomonas_salina.3